MENKSTSTWFALRNPVFCRLWLVSVLSGTFVSAQDVTATWLMNYLGASSFFLSLMAAAASAPFFVFTLPAGAVADIVNRRALIVSAVLWQGACSALLAFGAWADAISPGAVLALIFALGIGLAFSAPVWGAIVPALMVSTTLAGVAWALAGSELWVAGQRVMPGWVRGRMNAFLIMLGQGSIALGAVLWAAGVANVGLDLTFAVTAILALAVLALGHRFSLNFAAEASVDAAPLDHLHDVPVVPDDDDGPITITIEYAIATADRDEFRILMQEVQAICRRNGAFQCRLDESLNEPGLFRLEYLVSTWAEHLRMNMRMTVDETKVYKQAWDLNLGDSEPIVRHFRSTQRFMHLPGFGFSGRTFMNISRPRLVAVTSDA